MKTVAFLILVIAKVHEICSSSEGWFVPQHDGSLQWMTEEDFQNFALENTPLSRTAAVADYYLYTNGNTSNPEQLFLNDEASLQNSKFNKDYPTRIIIHGWQNNYKSNVNMHLRSALLDTGNYNVICVDWSSKSRPLNYATSVLIVPRIGKQVANFIDFLYTAGGMSFDTLILLGHSLGTHVSGFAGKNVIHGQIHQITGLDPALPLYSYEKPSERLNQNDARYVESVQTCGGVLGFLQPVGKAAFYPNGGRTQPGCGIDADGSCAHTRSYEYYAEAIRKGDFPTVKCGTYEEAVNKTCGSKYSSVTLGAYSNYVNAVGYFYVPVNKKAPFGQNA